MTDYSTTYTAPRSKRPSRVYETEAKNRATRGWNKERRKAQAERCRTQQPWKHATGPKTATGKARAAQNARKHGFTAAAWRDALQTLRQLLRIHRRHLKTLRVMACYGALPLDFGRQSCSHRRLFDGTC